MHLAASPLYPNQAFARRSRGLALQFHPEVEARGLERWFIGRAAEIAASEGIGKRPAAADGKKIADTGLALAALARAARGHQPLVTVSVGLFLTMW